jgi:hypothetical protein
MNQIEQVSREMSKRAEMAKLNRGREHSKGGGGGEIQDRKKSKKKTLHWQEDTKIRKLKKRQPMPSSYLTHSYQCHDLVKDEPQLSYQGSTCITYHVDTPTSPSHYLCRW